METKNVWSSQNKFLIRSNAAFSHSGEKIRCNSIMYNCKVSIPEVIREFKECVGEAVWSGTIKIKRQAFCPNGEWVHHKLHRPKLVYIYHNVVYMLGNRLPERFGENWGRSKYSAEVRARYACTGDTGSHLKLQLNCSQELSYWVGKMLWTASRPDLPAILYSVYWVS